MFIRADASTEIGAGHIMRCLALAEDLREYGVDCQFICRENPGHLQHLIAQRLSVHSLPGTNGRLDPKSDAAQTRALLRS